MKFGARRGFSFAVTGPPNVGRSATVIGGRGARHVDRAHGPGVPRRMRRETRVGIFRISRSCRRRFLRHRHNFCSSAGTPLGDTKNRFLAENFQSQPSIFYRDALAARDCNFRDVTRRIIRRRSRKRQRMVRAWLQFYEVRIVTCAQRRENEFLVATITSRNIAANPLCSCVRGAND